MEASRVEAKKEAGKKGGYLCRQLHTGQDAIASLAGRPAGRLSECSAQWRSLLLNPILQNNNNHSNNSPKLGSQRDKEREMAD